MMVRWWCAALLGLLVGCEAPVQLSTDPTCGDGGVVCGAAGQRVCVDPNTSATHCGGCGHACGQGVACAGGRCCAGLSCGRRCLGTAFDDTRRWMTGRETEGMHLYDLDRDGFDDLIGVNQLDETMTVYWGNAAGEAGTATRWPIGRINGWMAFGDVDRDGMTDFVAATQGVVGGAYQGTALRLYSLRSGRTLADVHGTRMPEQDNVNEVALLDTDRDGLLDIVARRMNTGCLVVHKGDGQGGFGEGRCVTTVETGPEQPTWLVPLDLERDGAMDLLVIQTHGARTVRFNPDGGVTVGTDALPTQWLRDFVYAQPMDLDRDGFAELALTRAVPSAAGFRLDWLPVAGGMIAAEGCRYDVPQQPALTGVGDFNGDGLPDVYGVVSCRGCPYTANLLLRR